uniref:Uncharacterized protein n=2 Tax=Oryza sativa subsp. japonica TaxID=39947 RepID=Q2R6U6_ORYSJ|nr:hypothetical protein LOC_Os11g18840 [Oryza sativa Japonica Group]ABA92719.1 hypothetical protein LOC_Os11g18839 [Oryza sativa Japonica Group]
MSWNQSDGAGESKIVAQRGHAV